MRREFELREWFVGNERGLVGLEIEFRKTLSSFVIERPGGNSKYHFYSDINIYKLQGSRINSKIVRAIFIRGDVFLIENVN